MCEGTVYGSTIKKEWSTGVIPEAKSCSWSVKGVKRIVLTPEMYSVTRKLCEKFANSEWQIMLIGEIREKDVLVTDYYIPKQEVGPATVRNKDCIDINLIQELGIVGTMHSHCNMGVFFSGTDDVSTNLSSGLKYHVVTNNRGEFNAVERMTLPCGMLKLVETSVDILLPDTELKGVENITEREYGFKSTYGTPLLGKTTEAKEYGYDGYPGYRDDWDEGIEERKRGGRKGKKKGKVSQGLQSDDFYTGGYSGLV